MILHGHLGSKFLAFEVLNMRDVDNQTFDKHGLLVDNLLDEEWKAWPKGEVMPTYEASTHGRFRRKITIGWQLLKPRHLMNDTVVVSINDNGKQKTKALKNIIAEVWIKNTFKAPNVKTVNGKEYDLHKRNLVWYDFRGDQKISTDLTKKITSRLKNLSNDQKNQIWEIMDHM